MVRVAFQIRSRTLVPFFQSHQVQPTGYQEVSLPVEQQEEHVDVLCDIPHAHLRQSNKTKPYQIMTSVWLFQCEFCVFWIIQFTGDKMSTGVVAPDSLESRSRKSNLLHSGENAGSCLVWKTALIVIWAVNIANSCDPFAECKIKKHCRMRSVCHFQFSTWWRCCSHNPEAQGIRI